MNDNARKWVEALRSGKYRQGRYTLYDPKLDTYCCLGVACEVFMQNNPGVLDKITGLSGTVFYDNTYTSLPTSVIEWLGLQSGSGAFFLEKEGTKIPACLIEWNDEKRKSFAEIADLIESEPEGLFENE